MTKESRTLKLLEQKQGLSSGENFPAATTDKQALTKSEENLLKVLADPAVLALDISKICKVAEISRPTYYAAFKNQNFIKALEAQTQIVLKEAELPVIHNVLGKAKDPEVKSHHWAQMALKMMGRLKESASKPALINVVFTNVERPKIAVNEFIEGEFEEKEF